jgi:hypothetical protein
VKEADASGAEHISNPRRGIFMVRNGMEGLDSRSTTSIALAVKI